VTFGWMIAGGSWLMGLVYILVAQPLGSLIAIGMIKAIFDTDSFVHVVNKLGTPMLNEFILTENQGFAVEVFGCIVLYCVVLFANMFVEEIVAITRASAVEMQPLNDNSGPQTKATMKKLKKQRMKNASKYWVGKPVDLAAASASGFTLAVLVTSCAFLTGGSFNFYRWLWPAVFSEWINDDSAHAWIYIVSGLVGAIVAGLLRLGYSRLIRQRFGAKVRVGVSLESHHFTD